LLLALLAGCAQETIAHQQEEREANTILVLLRQGGMEPTKLKDEESRELRFNIMVPQDQAASALSLLEAHDLPKTPRPDTAAMFQESGMIPTTEQERAKRIVGVEGDIVNALRKVPRVVSVEAAVSIPPDDPLRDPTEERPKPKASVIMVYRADDSGTPPMSAEDVQKFVQAKLPELKTVGVNVLLLPSKEGMSEGGGAGNGSAMAPIIDPAKGCVEKERVIGIEVCAGNRRKVINLVVIAGIVAGLLAALAVVAVLRAMSYRKDLTRLTAQFQSRGGK
jgi:type III secretion system YscJ/HrcJ family lipoprotein